MPITVGTCGNCGGAVQMPEMWGGPTPAVPTCARCGAAVKNPYGPRIEMDIPQSVKELRTVALDLEALQKITSRKINRA